MSSAAGGAGPAAAGVPGGDGDPADLLYEQFSSWLKSRADATATDDEVKAHFGKDYSLLGDHAINKLLQQGELQLLQQQDGKEVTLVYKLIDSKFKGLDPEDMLVYQKIQEVGNSGIMSQALRRATGLQQNSLTKILTRLENRQLIKSVHSVFQKNRKFYLLADLVPSRELTGGPWYTDRELDTEFVKALKDFIMDFLDQKEQEDERAEIDDGSEGCASVEEMSDQIKMRGLVQGTELAIDDVDQLVQNLVSDAKLEKVSLGGEGDLEGGKSYYRRAPMISDYNMLTVMPCGQCPVFESCEDGGLISPATCQYMAQWLKSEEGALDW